MAKPFKKLLAEVRQKKAPEKNVSAKPKQKSQSANADKKAPEKCSWKLQKNEFIKLEPTTKPQKIDR